MNDRSEPKGRRKTVARHARQSCFLSPSIVFSKSYVRVSPMETVGDTRKEQQCLQQSSQRVVRTLVVVTREPRGPGVGSVSRGHHHNARTLLLHTLSC